eukprot:823151-Pyramimonas_sp.AAC.1
MNDQYVRKPLLDFVRHIIIVKSYSPYARSTDRRSSGMTHHHHRRYLLLRNLPVPHNSCTCYVARGAVATSENTRYGVVVRPRMIKLAVAGACML